MRGTSLMRSTVNSLYPESPSAMLQPAYIYLSTCFMLLLFLSTSHKNKQQFDHLQALDRESDRKVILTLSSPSSFLQEMNSTTPSFSSNEPTQTNPHSLRYFIGITFAVVFLMTSIALASYYCSRVTTPPRPQQRSPHQSPDDNSTPVDVGIDENTLYSYPKLLYSEAKLHNKQNASSCCSICLSDYSSTDMLRILPDCGHQFHLKCVDPWLRQHPTCPVCRSSPIPTPLSTPLAEVAPLSIRIV